MSPCRRPETRMTLLVPRPRPTKQIGSTSTHHTQPCWSTPAQQDVNMHAASVSNDLSDNVHMSSQQTTFCSNLWER